MRIFNKEIFVDSLAPYWWRSFMAPQWSHRIACNKIHVRHSFNEAFEIINRLNHETLRGVFHCFTGNITDAQKIISLQGFYLGIGGVLTFKNSELDKTIAEIDLRHLVLETDSPYLTPNPFRGKRNESKYLIHIAEQLAKIHNISIEQVAAITTKNAKTLFRI